jgi:Rrf2 family transcriptional regulator, iron-sulfur cluster assembly transcription factor
MEILKRNGDYSIRALLVLGTLGEGEILAADRLARKARVAEPLLRKLLQKLVRAGVVESTKGAGGGFRLSRAPKDVSVLEVIEPVQGKLAINRCFLGRSQCSRQGQCRISSKLAGIQEHLVQFFKGITLAELMAEEPAPTGKSKK